MTTTATPETVLDRVEFECRRTMAERAGLPVTWLTRARRAELWQEIHVLLDQWNGLRG